MNTLIEYSNKVLLIILLFCKSLHSTDNIFLQVVEQTFSITDPQTTIEIHVFVLWKSPGTWCVVLDSLTIKSYKMTVPGSHPQGVEKEA